eukprot:COSAG01_NODE_3898_length_5568_cov_2.935272_5_plen_278_part_00
MAAARAAAALVCLAGGLVLPEPAAADEDLTTLNSDREDFQCDKVYLGEKVGWADVYKYHDDDKSCKIEFSELQAVCKVHAAECMDFLKSKQDKSKTGMMDCHSHDMTTRMNSGTQDVCCDYTDGKFCALFTPSSADDTGEECVKGASNPNPPATRLPAHDGGVVLDSKILRMPLPTRGCATCSQPLLQCCRHPEGRPQVTCFGLASGVPECVSACVVVASGVRTAGLPCALPAWIFRNSPKSTRPTCCSSPLRAPRPHRMAQLIYKSGLSGQWTPSP